MFEKNIPYIKSKNANNVFINNKNQNFGINIYSKNLQPVKMTSLVQSAYDKTQMILNQQQQIQQYQSIVKNEQNKVINKINTVNYNKGIFENNERYNEVYFNKYGVFNNIEPALSKFAYVFFTKPNLNIANFYRYGNEYELKSDIFSMLTYNTDTVNGVPPIVTTEPIIDYHKYNSATNNISIKFPLIPILTNNIMNFDAQDITLKTNETGKNKRNKVVVEGLNYDNSVGSNEISTQFLETQNRTISTLFSYIVEYIHNVKYNKFSTSEYCRNNYYLDYAISIYYFLLAPDLMTITHYTKFTGVIPTNKPYSNTNWDRGEAKILKTNINLKYADRDDNNLQILKDFNSTLGSVYTINEFNSINKIVNAKYNWGAIPYVVIDNTNYKHKLLFSIVNNIQEQEGEINNERYKFI